MKTLTIKNLTIQVDGRGKNPLKEALEALDLINLALQNEPSGLGAQILVSGIDSSDVSVEEFGEDLE